MEASGEDVCRRKVIRSALVASVSEKPDDGSQAPRGLPTDAPPPAPRPASRASDLTGTAISRRVRSRTLISTPRPPRCRSRTVQDREEGVLSRRPFSRRCCTYTCWGSSGCLSASCLPALAMIDSGRSASKCSRATRSLTTAPRGRHRCWSDEVCLLSGCPPHPTGHARASRVLSPSVSTASLSAQRAHPPRCCRTGAVSWTPFPSGCCGLLARTPRHVVRMDGGLTRVSAGQIRVQTHPLTQDRPSFQRLSCHSWCIYASHAPLLPVHCDFTSYTEADGKKENAQLTARYANLLLYCFF